MWWVVSGIAYIICLTCTMAILKVGSDCDDELLGGLQYEETN